MKYATLIFLFLAVAISACKGPAPADPLEVIGVLGNWEIQSRLYDNIGNMSALCCEFIEFTPDRNFDDMIGNYHATSTGSDVQGVFEVDESAMTITFTRNQDSMVWNYQLNDDALAFTYEEGGQIISEDWIRRD